MILRLLLDNNFFRKIHMAHYPFRHTDQHYRKSSMENPQALQSKCLDRIHKQNTTVKYNSIIIIILLVYIRCNIITICVYNIMKKSLRKH